ncbi:MAG TPA: RIO1 family regulatory kinase/ATPase [Chloroflexota bacterium]|nr:RIO1 family regulatory kinase/ATPase [Chloroflexota bacterium]
MNSQDPRFSQEVAFQSHSFDAEELADSAADLEEIWLDRRWQEPVSRRPRGRRVLFRDAAEGSHGRVTDEVTTNGANYPMTYKPARFETGWLGSSLRSFYEGELIVDVVAQVKGGKEANVYRCTAHPRTGVAWLAAKVYRPRKFRNLANDRVYREGRTIITADGRPVKPTDDRILRALGKKTSFGVQVQHTSWLMHEYTTLSLLQRAGAAVPEAVAANENAILIGYRGDDRRAAPTLKEIRPRPAEVQPLFDEVMRNIVLLLQHGLVHGDLSAYNILYWQGRITLIDFPQVVDVHLNRNAEGILLRDVRRICDYFRRQGLDHNPTSIAHELWEQYGEPDYGLPELPEMESDDWAEDD